MSLENNTYELQTLLNEVNALPEIGSGSVTENLDAEISEQAAKIDQLLTILDGKAAGGGGEYETCTLKIVRTDSAIELADIQYMTLNDDNSLYYRLYSAIDLMEGNEIVFEGVVVNHPILLLARHPADSSANAVFTANANSVSGEVINQGVDETRSRCLFKCTVPNEETIITLNAPPIWG